MSSLKTKARREAAQFTADTFKPRFLEERDTLWQAYFQTFLQPNFMLNENLSTQIGHAALLIALMVHSDCFALMLGSRMQSSRTPSKVCNYILPATVQQDYNTALTI